MFHQRVGTTAGSGIIVILAITIFSFVAVYEHNQDEVTVTPQQIVHPIKPAKEIGMTPSEQVKNECKHSKKYHNSTSNYTITIPSESWCLPDESDNDPHITSSDNCFDSDYPTTQTEPCIGLEIQDHGITSTPDNKAELTASMESAVHSVTLKSLVKGATVIKSDAPSPAEGWNFQYIILFTKEQRQFLVFSNDESTESIIKTFTLSQDWKTYRSEATTPIFKTEDWNNYDSIQSDTVPIAQLEYPGNWRLDGTVFYDSTGTKVAELAPGIVSLGQSQHCFDKTFVSTVPEINQFISKEQFKIGTNVGTKRILRSHIDGSGEILFSNTYCVEKSKNAFIISFLEKERNSSNMKLFEKIVSTLKFLP